MLLALVLTRLGSNRGSDHVAPRSAGQGGHTPLSLPFLKAKASPPALQASLLGERRSGPVGFGTRRLMHRDGPPSWDVRPLPLGPVLAANRHPAMALCPVPTPEQSMASPQLPPHCPEGSCTVSMESSLPSFWSVSHCLP